jgi:hypothetical protein
VPRLWEPGSFTERHDLLVRLQRGQKELRGVHAVLEHSVLDPGVITAKLFGDRGTYEGLLGLMGVGQSWLHLESDEQDQRTTLWSDKATLRRASFESGINSPDKPHQEIGELSLGDITVRTHHPDIAWPQRRVVFSLWGPEEIWQVSEHHQFDSRGAVQTAVGNPTIPLDDDIPFGVGAWFWTHYEYPPGARDRLVMAKRLRLEVTPKEPLLNAPDDEVVRVARELVEDLTLLMSLVGQQWFLWFNYTLLSRTTTIGHTRSLTPAGPRNLRPERSLVDSSRIRQFLRRSLPELRRLRQSGLDLTVPIQYFIAATESRSVEQQFAISFLALEKLKALYPDRGRVGAAVLTDKLSELLTQAEGWLTLEHWEQGEVGAVLKALRGLRNPTLQEVLDAMLVQYHIKWDDLYPPGVAMSLVQTRNALFHGSAQLGIDPLSRELERLRAIIARLVLRMLGWEDLSNAPDAAFLTWLQTPP